MTYSSNELEKLPCNDSLKIKGVDYIEFYVGNARQAAHFYKTAFGFQPVAYAGLETGVRDYRSIVLKQSHITFVVTSGITLESPISKYINLHGDGVYDIALLVENASDAFKAAVSRGARPIQEPTIIKGEEGYIVKATIASYSGDIIHSFIERNNYNGFSPQYHPISNTSLPTTTGLTDIDHIVINVEIGNLDVWSNFYCSVLEFHQTQHFTSDKIATKYSALASKVLQNSTGCIKFPINEPAQGYRKSQIQEYLDFHGGPGVQHIALRTNDIIKTVQHLRANGVEFLRTSDAYYQKLKARIGQVDEDLNILQNLNILIDRDSEGYLLQIFTQPLTDRPTIFFEIIQRKGAKGFGDGNFKALFEAIEAEQAARGNL